MKLHAGGSRADTSEKKYMTRYELQFAWESVSEKRVELQKSAILNWRHFIAYNKSETAGEIRHLPRAVQKSSGAKNLGKLSDKENSLERYLFLAA